MQIYADMTYEQYFEANRLWLLNTTRKRRWNFWALMYVYPVLGVWFALIAVVLWLVDHHLDWAAWMSIGASVFYFCRRFYFPIKVRKCYDRAAKQYPKRMTLSSTGMHVERPDNMVSSDISWSALEGWMDRPDSFFGLLSDTSFIRIPKDKLTPAEQDEVRGWLAAASKQIT